VRGLALAISMHYDVFFLQVGYFIALKEKTWRHYHLGLCGRISYLNFNLQYLETIKKKFLVCY